MKMNKIAASLVFLTVASLSLTASAATVTVATPVDVQIYINSPTVVPGFFSDTYNFTISVQSDTADSVSNHLLTGFIKRKTVTITDISNLNLSIYDASNTLLSSTGDNISANGINVAAGSYHAVVTGNAIGTNGGLYSLSLYAEPSAVPVPAAFWLLGSGLLGLVGIARRKEVA